MDAAFNLIPEQVATLKSDPNVRTEGLVSLDFVYMAMTCSAELNRALGVQEARQAVASAIDYDGIRDNLLGGTATRSANFFPVGMLGSTEQTTKEIGPRQDLDRARMLLQKAGFADGFEFEVSYGNAAVSGLSYGILAQKLQADLARVWHPPEAQSDGPGEPAHPVHQRQFHIGADLLEPGWCPAVLLGHRDGRTRGKAFALDAAGRPCHAGARRDA
ncbi:MAG: hypothetical protein HC814_06890 [Rhodobacteraceae bacterium]|nr:hypothetical protein [Paracoccaceae bacterium]